ncbi:unnamed protein product [Ascophyllum nodosum]
MNDWKASLGGSRGTEARRNFTGPNGSSEKVDYSRLPEGSDDEEADWIQRQIRGHKTQMDHQDNQLSDIGETAARLGSLSLEISKELDQQNKMLDNVNQDFEEAITGLDAVTKKTKDLIKKSGERYGGLILLNSNRPAGRGDTLICKILLILILY